MYDSQMFVMYLISLGFMSMIGIGLTEWCDKRLEVVIDRIERRISQFK